MGPHERVGVSRWSWVLLGLPLVLGSIVVLDACLAPSAPSPRTAEETSSGDKGDKEERGGSPPTELSSEAPRSPTRDDPREPAPARPSPPLSGSAAPPPEPPFWTEPLPETPSPEPAAADDQPILLRVGLATDLDEATIPCCRQELVLASGNRRWAVRSPLRVLPDAGSSRRGFFRLQVAALKDEGQARELARSLGARSGYPADFHFDAGVDLYRVRLGRFADREAAEAARGRLEVLGVTGAWIVGEGDEISDPAFLLVRPGQDREAEDAVRLPGRWLTLSAAEPTDQPTGAEAHEQAPEETPVVPGLAPGIGRYRGRWLVHLNDRGKLNLINEVEIEDYVRSVVPSEMGPELYGQIEALKAQAVAARTYTLRNLAEFRGEGYDICATPRCQVYRGVMTEHPLSDRAVRETRRQVLVYDARLIDARYSATCGGHTEDVHVVFPLEDEPYLRGVPCPEAGGRPLDGGLPAGLSLEAGLSESLVPASSRDPRAALEERLRRLAGRIGLPLSRDRLRSLERREVRRFVGSVFDLALDPRMAAPADSVEALLERPPVGWSEREIVRARRLLETGLLDREPRLVAPGEADGIPLALARILDRIDEADAFYLANGDGELGVRWEDGSGGRVALPKSFATFERQGDGAVTAGLELVPGDRLRLIFWHPGQGKPAELLGVVDELKPEEAAFRVRSSFDSWRRFKSDADLARRIATRYPGFDFRDLEVLSRGVSGRVGAVRLLGAGGRQVEVTGLAVRWTLDIPDNRFTARRATARDGRTGWMFDGSGWGHGVGLCQIGSVNLAGRGADYRQILHHYYTGVSLARVRGVPERWEDPRPTIAAPAVRTRR